MNKTHHDKHIQQKKFGLCLEVLPAGDWIEYPWQADIFRKSNGCSGGTIDPPNSIRCKYEGISSLPLHEVKVDLLSAQFEEPFTKRKEKGSLVSK